MKKSFLILFASICFIPALAQQDQPEPDTIVVLEPVELNATRAGSFTPVTRTNISRQDIERRNLGRDLPFLINQAPAVVAFSDAGNGVGYTGLRIRGTDASRINVTLNGIPFNDAESQGTFFVDLPDFASSVGSIQVQRGVGTSTNGAGAFGATINISTNEVRPVPYAELANSYGSFSTHKHTLQLGSGLVDNKFTTDFRLSLIKSNGYIDRASSDLRSHYFSTALLLPKTQLRFNQFSGKEKTYQAWYGVSEADLETNRTVNYAGMEKPGEPYHNETDNYWQDHYQFFFNQQFLPRLQFQSALFYVKGKGYYEQYKAGEEYADYGLLPPSSGNDTIFETDLVRQLWLDNDFYGSIYSLQFRQGKTKMTLGGGWNKYEGAHFGKVIWAEKGLSIPANWYNQEAWKTDHTIYYKQETGIGRHFHLFYDLQFRNVNYHLGGFRNNPDLLVKQQYRFFNPKIGMSFHMGNWQAYISYSKGQKEPNRDDFEAGMEQLPRPEKLHDLELGLGMKKEKISWQLALYHMQYVDQLVLTGQINDVGAYTRTNIPRSYRAGIELDLSAMPFHWAKINGNISLSRNRVQGLTEYVDDYDNGGQQIFTYQSTPLAFSPSLISYMEIRFFPLKNLETGWEGKFVSDQYLDNTGQSSRKLDAFLVQDIGITYRTSLWKLKEIELTVKALNILDELYEPNGYTFSYVYGGNLVTENYYYPMAGRNFMGGIRIKL